MKLSSIIPYALVPCGLVAVWLLSRAKSKQILREGFHTWAVVVDYKSEYVRVAGSWTWLEYPQVDYITKEGDLQHARLKYASSTGPLLDLEEEVEVVLHENILYYKPVLTQNFGGFLKSLC